MALLLATQLFPCPDCGLAHVGLCDNRVSAPASASVGRQGHG